MKKVTRLLSYLLVLAMLLGMLPTTVFAADVVASGYCGGEGDGSNLIWTLDSDGILSIVGKGKMKEYDYWTMSGIARPSYYKYRGQITAIVVDEGVTSIGSLAFDDLDKVNVLTMPTTIERIGTECMIRNSVDIYINDLSKWCAIEFNCPLSWRFNLFINRKCVTDLEIPAEAEKISSYAFYGAQISNVILEQGVTSIGTHAFQNCENLISCTLPDSLTEIGNDAFSGNLKMQFCNLPQGLTTIEDGVFAACKVLQDVTIPDSVTSIGDKAFFGCGALSIESIPDSVASIGEQAFAGCSNLTSITIGNGVTVIDREAFYNCHNLSSVIIGNSVTSIGDHAFCECSSLSSINIPASVTNIGREAFVYCNSLSAVYITSIEAWCKIDFLSNPLENAGALYLNGELVREVTIPEGIMELKNLVFAGGKYITSVTLPDGIISIGDEAFCDCDSLTTISIPNSVTSIGAHAFSSCNSLRTFAVPEGVTIINECTFSSCTELAEITLPDTLESIGDHSFDYCHKLTSIVIPTNVSSIGRDSFYDCRSLTDIYFCGDAPSVVAAGEWRPSFEADIVTLYCTPGATGWTNSDAYDASMGTWNGYKLSFWNTGTELRVLSQAPAIKGTLNAANPVISMTFNHEIESVQTGWSNGDFSIVRQIEEDDGWKFETVYSLSEDDNAETDVTIDGCTVIIDASEAELILGETYYVLMDNGVITFKDTDETIGFGGTQWTFTVSGEKSGTFRYKAMCGVTDYPYSYSDSWFQGSTTQYNHELAKMSIRVALAAYRTGPSVETNGNQLGAGAEYIEALMEDEMGFTNLDIYYPSPQRNSIGYSIGSKKIPSEDGTTKSLILVAIRGGGYGTEWAGNFMMGTGELSDGIAGDLHEGFSRAAEQVEDGLASYMRWGKDDGFLSEDCIVWVTSYSRGAAVTNLFAKRLDDGNIEGLGTDNVFAYCFACPQNSRASNLTASKYNNIMNVVNPLDFVTMVAMSDWDYGRYGQTFHIPYEEGVVNYSALKSRMQQEYRKILQAGTSSDSEYTATLQIAGQRDMTEGLMNWLAGEFKSPSVYTTLYQEALMEMVEAFTLNEWKWVSNTASAIMLLTKIGLIAKGIFSLPDTPYDLIETVLSTDDNMNAIMAVELFAFGAIENGGFTKSPISYTHYPELYLAWLDSLSGDEIIKVDGKYRKVFVNCPVDISVYDSSDKLVGQIVDGEVQNIENGISVYIDDNGQFVFSLPRTEEYRIDLVATDKGTVTYTVSEHNIETGDSERVVSYPLIAIEKEDTLVGTIEDLDEIQNATYSLSCNGASQTASVDQKDDALCEFLVNYEIEGNGTVTGGGKAVYGEYRKLLATPDEGNAFSGWYIDDICVSEDEEYRFCVLDNTNLTAKFSSNTTTIASGYCGGEDDGTNLTWVLTEDGTLTISGKGTMKDWGGGSAPWSGRTDKIQKVIIDSKVTTIGAGAFYKCFDLASIVIGSGVQTIGEMAFFDCESLTSVEIPGNVTTIGRDAFCSCNNMTSVTISNGVEVIGDDAFGGATSLTTVNIPNSVTTIGTGVFYNCRNLTSATFEDGATTIGRWMFDGCKNLTSVSIPNSVTTIGEQAFAFCESLTSITLPNNLKSIEDWAFYNSGLTSISIPESVTSIGDYAFYCCKNLTSVTIPKNIDAIGKSAFSGCVFLSSAFFEGNAPDVYAAEEDNHTFDAYAGLPEADEITLYYTEGTTGWTDSEFFDAEAETWKGYKLAVRDHNSPDDPAHTHVYDRELVTAEALKSKADCDTPAVYYKSCECGEVGTVDTFTYGTANGHAPFDWQSNNEEHWKHCLNCSDLIAGTKGSHVDNSGDNRCDVCGYRMGGNGQHYWPDYNFPVLPTMPVQMPFTDVYRSDWFYDDVQNAWENDLIDGVTATSFRPNETLTVAQAIKLAVALHQLDTVGYVTLSNGYTNWYDTYVDYAVENSIVENKYASYTTAQMNAPISRNEFVHIFYGAMSDYPQWNSVADNAIPDVKLGDKYADEIYTFYRAGILTGNDAVGTFAPNSSIKRSEVAAILSRMYDSSARKYISLG